MMKSVFTGSHERVSAASSVMFRCLWVTERLHQSAELRLGRLGGGRAAAGGDGVVRLEKGRLSLGHRRTTQPCSDWDL